MSWSDLWTRLRRPAPRGRRAILKGGGEAENIGDVMMRHVAETHIRSLGFETIYRVGHGDVPPEVARASGSIDAIFVLSSIQYSDAWPTPTLLERLERSIRFHRHFPHATVVFLPSTWGAFEPRHRDALAQLVAGATVLVRDRFSVDSINGLLGAAVAQYCPDLAFLYPAADASVARPLLESTVGDLAKPLLGIIPNQRCVEPGVTPLGRPEDYLDFLARLRDVAVGRGFHVVGISHMLNTDRDAALLQALGIPCITANDATLVRSAIANLTVCICSRYHGLISCLSQGTPVVALGWHHKYRNLMNDMELGTYHLSVAELPRDPAPLLDALYENRDELRRRIARNVAAAKELIAAHAR